MFEAGKALTRTKLAYYYKPLVKLNLLSPQHPTLSDYDDKDRVIYIEASPIHSTAVEGRV